MKICKNNKGFSLVELLVVIGIIGILSAFAIPAYIGYQAKARGGVAKSIVVLGYRIIKMEESLGRSLAVLTNDAIKAKIESKDKSQFTFNYEYVNKTKWCLGIVGSDKYDDMDSCVNESGIVKNKTTSGVSCGSITAEGQGPCETEGCNWVPAHCENGPGVGQTNCTGGTPAKTWKADACSSANGVCKTTGVCN